MKTKNRQQHQSRQLKTNFWKDAEFPIAVAHRGGDAAGFAKRNTMSAFESAHKLGYKYMETDVADTKDGQVVISHGAKTSLGAYFRGTFTFRKLSSLSYEQVLKDLKVDGEPIPLLTDLLNKFPDTKFIVDAKTDGVVEPLAKLMHGRNCFDHVIIHSFEYKRLIKLQKLLDDKAEMGMWIGRNPKMVDRLYRLRSGRLSHLEAIGINFWLASARRIKLIHRQHLRAVIWTPNKPKSIRRAVRNGADVIISDRTVLLKQILETDTRP